HLTRLKSWCVWLHWNGRNQRLWESVIQELQMADKLTKGIARTTLIMCVNYGGRAEITDAAHNIATQVADGTLSPKSITDKTVSQHLRQPDVPDVDLFLRTSGEQRLSNFLLWQSAYAELIFLDVLWPDVNRKTLWDAVETYASRDRRYGGAVDAAVTF